MFKVSWDKYYVINREDLSMQVMGDAALEAWLSDNWHDSDLCLDW